MAVVSVEDFELAGDSLPSEAIPFLSDSEVPRVAFEPCPPRFVGSVMPATVNLGSSNNSGVPRLELGDAEDSNTRSIFFVSPPANSMGPNVAAR